MLFVFHMLGLGQGISQQMDHDRPIDLSSAMDDYIVYINYIVYYSMYIIICSDI